MNKTRFKIEIDLLFNVFYILYLKDITIYYFSIISSKFSPYINIETIILEMYNKINNTISVILRLKVKIKN